MNVITVNLRGELADLLGPVWELAVATPAEAVRAIEANTGKLFRHLATAHERGVAFQVIVERNGVLSDLNDERMTHPVGSAATITFVPVLQGSKEAGIFQVILGIAIIAVATVASGGSLLAAGGFGWGGTFAIGGFAQFSAHFGLAIALGGLATVVAGTPKAAKIEERPDQKPSYQFNGPTNRTRQGNVVPVLYGQMIVGSQRVSGGVTNEDYVAPAVDVVPDPGTGGGEGGGSPPPYYTGTDGNNFDPNLGDTHGGWPQQLH